MTSPQAPRHQLPATRVGEGSARAKERESRAGGKRACRKESAGGNRTAHLYLSRKRRIKIPCDLREERGGETGEWRREEGSENLEAAAASLPRSAACPPKSAPPPLYSSIRDYSNVHPLSTLNSFLCSASRPAVHNISTSFQSPLFPLFFAPPRSAVMCSPLFLCSLMWSAQHKVTKSIYWFPCWLAALLCH
jgi:hypothetical protein